MTPQPTPLHWPNDRPRNRYPDPGRTRVSLANAIPSLLEEMERLGGYNVVISSNAKLKQDGLPYSQQPRSISDVGVAVWFRLRETNCLFCLSYDHTDSIAGNLREIGLAVAGLRAFQKRAGVKLYVLLSAFQVADTKTEQPPPKQAAPPKPEPAAAEPPPRPRKPATGWRAVLGVPAVCPWDVVHDAYKQLAQRNHPDRGGSSSRMQQINEAYAEAKRTYRHQ